MGIEMAIINFNPAKNEVVLVSNFFHDYDLRLTYDDAVLNIAEIHKHFGIFVCLFCCFTSQVNSYGHCGTVSSPNHTFSWAGLNKRLTSNSCTYFRL